MKKAYGYEGEKWTAYWWFVGWDQISLGISVDVRIPNIELHLPFGFIRAGHRGGAVTADGKRVRLTQARLDVRAE